MGFGIEYKVLIDRDNNFLDVPWRDGRLFLRRDGLNSYRVLGMFMGSRDEGQQRIYNVEPLPKKLYKNCRAFIQGCGQLDNPAHVRVSFASQEKNGCFAGRRGS